MAMRSSFTRARAGGLALAVVLGVATFTARPLLRPTVAQRVIENPTEQQLFERILSKYQDFTFDQFQAALSKRSPPAATVSFDPTQVKFFDRVRTKLILRTRLAPGVETDCDRELRDAALLSQLIESTGQLGHLRAINDLLNFFVGRSDNLGVFAMVDLLNEQKITAVKDLAEDISLGRLKRALENGNFADQMIRSQAIVSNPGAPFKVLPPSSFLVFGQRFTVDSFILSHMVFDSIVFKGRKQERMMPSGLDLMAALGNDEASTLVSDEVRRWNYDANLLASRDFIRQLDPRFWRENVCNIWLDAIRTLDDDVSTVKNVPESMRTAAWQRKQLRTQLASWAELRHDNVLYSKQSYTGVPACEYPAGYVEPYPRFFSY